MHRYPKITKNLRGILDVLHVTKFNHTFYPIGVLFHFSLVRLYIYIYIYIYIFRLWISFVELVRRRCH